VSEPVIACCALGSLLLTAKLQEHPDDLFGDRAGFYESTCKRLSPKSDESNSENLVGEIRFPAIGMMKWQMARLTHHCLRLTYFVQSTTHNCDDETRLITVYI
jgi:hypothetical protein